MTALSSALSIALVVLLGAQSVSAQGTSDVVCQPGFEWATNRKAQNPCLVAAWLQSQCNSGTFSVNKIPDGYHYIGPTNDTTTQNPCICTTPVYSLVAACGACQNRTWISWYNWRFNCPSSFVADQGVYPGNIPTDTSVPHWAYLKPSDTNDFFNVTVAKLATGPESSQVLSSSTRPGSSTSSSSSRFAFTVTVTTSSTAPPTTSTSGGGDSPTNVGAIAGGVVGGVVGIALIALLGFLLLRKKPATTDPSGAGTYGAVGAGAAGAGGNTPAPEMGQYNNSGALSPTSPLSGATQLPYAQSQLTGQSQGTPYSPTVGAAGYYNPNDPAHVAPAPSGYPQVQPGPYYGGEPYNAGGKYSGMPEV